MQTLAHRRSLGIVGVLLLLASLFMVIAGPAAAIPQSNPSFPTVTCGGEWHWIHNQTDATSGTLTAVFANAGTIVVGNDTESPSTNLHYYINLTAGDTLLSAGDNVDGGMLLLSHYPTCPTTTTAAPTTTMAPTTTTTVQDTTTSTVPEPTTTSTVQDTTTSTVPEPTTTSTVPEPTTTSTVPEPTTTSTVQDTTTSTEPTTTSTVPEPTTTSTVPEPTTTTTRDRETTTTEMTTTTTAPTTTETVPEVSVAGIQIEAPVAAQVTQATLPFTGVSTTSMAVIAAGLAAMGILLLALSRQSEERNPARSWN